MTTRTRRPGVKYTILCISLLVSSAYMLWPSLKTLYPSYEFSDWGNSSPWTYQFSRDANNNGLSQSQCRIAFPDFYKDIESAVASRRGNPVRLDELEIKDDLCLVRVLIFNAEVCLYSCDTRTSY